MESDKKNDKENDEENDTPEKNERGKKLTASPLLMRALIASAGNDKILEDLYDY